MDLIPNKTEIFWKVIDVPPKIASFVRNPGIAVQKPYYLQNNKAWWEKTTDQTTRYSSYFEHYNL